MESASFQTTRQWIDPNLGTGGGESPTGKAEKSGAQNSCNRDRPQPPSPFGMSAELPSGTPRPGAPPPRAAKPYSSSAAASTQRRVSRSEEHTSELQSPLN